mmetsp:Transcript_69025/g.114728  ORF Transcript_69025/g.114728 Transcript_69025/m.114728 type:complete len:193 (-) Transcript_69025:339-917(-)
MNDLRSGKTIKKTKAKRLTSCGECKACLRSECGICINCVDKAKFGGQGVRKQCCVNRRCLRLNCNANQSVPQLRVKSPKQSNQNEQGDHLFWAAVAGCMRLNSSDDEHFIARKPCESPVPTPTLDRPTPSNSDPASVFCFKLASLLAYDGRLASKPIALRALQQASYSQQCSIVQCTFDGEALKGIGNMTCG